jgi:hypothetical protein
MAELFLLHPEVAGGWGHSTKVADQSGESDVPNVTQLEYAFEGWLGDELLESFPCFIVTESLAKDLTAAGLSGVAFDEVKVSKTDTFKELYPRKKFPAFKRLLPKGKVVVKGGKVKSWSGDDLSLTEKAELVVSAAALKVLKEHHLEQCEIDKLKA